MDNQNPKLEILPLEPMDMHAPIEVTVAVRMVTKDGQTGRMMYDLPAGQVPTRAQILEVIAPALAQAGEARPMDKAEFVAFITTRATGAPVPMAGDQHFVPVPADIPRQLLVDAVIGAAEYSKNGFDVLQDYDAVSLDVEDNRVYHQAALLELPEEILMKIYQRMDQRMVTA